MTAHVCGIDLGKTVFHLIGMSKEGQIVVKRRFSRKQLIAYMANIPTCLIGMEACAGAHFLARVLMAQGHDVKLMPAEYVRPFVKSNTNDYVDAEAIAEAVQRPTMRFVPVKNEHSSISRRCTGYAIIGLAGALRSSIRSAAFCSSMELL